MFFYRIMEGLIFAFELFRRLTKLFESCFFLLFIIIIVLFWGRITLQTNTYKWITQLSCAFLHFSAKKMEHTPAERGENIDSPQTPFLFERGLMENGMSEKKILKKNTLHAQEKKAVQNKGREKTKVKIIAPSGFYFLVVAGVFHNYIIVAKISDLPHPHTHTHTYNTVALVNGTSLFSRERERDYSRNAMHSCMHTTHLFYYTYYT